MRFSGTTVPSCEPAAGLGAACAIAFGRSSRCQCASVANSGVDVPSAISGSSEGKKPRRPRRAAGRATGRRADPRPAAARRAGGGERREAGEDLRRRHLGRPRPRRAAVIGAVVFSANTSAGGASGSDSVSGTSMSRGTSGSASCSILVNVGSRSLSSDGRMLAARAQRGLDLGQHAAVGQEAVERDVELVDLRREVGQHALHERPPHARIGIDRTRRRADRVEDVAHRERVVDVARTGVAQQHLDAQVERGHLAVREAVEEAGRVLERRLPVVVERGQHAQRRERRVGVGPPSLAPLAFDHAPLEEIAQRLVEAARATPRACCGTPRSRRRGCGCASRRDRWSARATRDELEQLHAILREAGAQDGAALVRAHLLQRLVGSGDGRAAPEWSVGHGSRILLRRLGAVATPGFDGWTAQTDGVRVRDSGARRRRPLHLARPVWRS